MIDEKDYEALDAATEQNIAKRVNLAPFPKFLGLSYEKIKKDYACMRLPFRPELNQTAGMYHGGAIASLIDTVVAGVVLSGLTAFPKKLATVDMHVHYTNAAVDEDILAYARTRKRGRTMVFLEVDVIGEKTGKLIAHGALSYMLVY